MICLKSPKSSEFAFLKTNLRVFHYVLTTIQLNVKNKNSEIKKKCYGPSGTRTRNPCGL